METQVDRVVEAARQLSYDELKLAIKRIIAILEEIDAKERLASILEEVDAKDRQDDKIEEKEFEKIPFNEGMALYHQIKQRHSDLFRELADL
jgi:hypothetical protein